MFKNYMKSGIRNLLRHKLFTTINAFGLGLSFACCLLIGAYILNELSYDTFHKSPENVYRVLVKRTSPMDNSVSSTTPRFLSAFLDETFPEIESAAQFRLMPRITGIKGKKFLETQVVFTDQSFFNVFTFPGLSGDPSKALANPNFAVLTKSYAKKIFGNENPLGKTLQVLLDYYGEKIADLQVASVIDDVPSNSHFKFEVAASYSLLVNSAPAALSWNIFEVKTYVRFKRPVIQKEFETKLAGFVEQTGGNANGREYELQLQPLKSIHLSDPIPFDDIEQTSLTDIYFFAGISLLVLLIAFFNYIMLSTARFTKRIKEIGVRKIIGASSRSLIYQFMIEALLLALIAFPIALTVSDIAYKGFSGLLGKEFPLNIQGNPAFLFGSLAVFLLFGIISGFFPSLFFAKISSIGSLKGQNAGYNSANRLRRSLIVMQFSITIALFICAGIMYSQFKFIQSRDLGYKSDNIIVVPTLALGEKSLVLKQQVLSMQGADMASLTGWLPGYIPMETIMGNPNGDGSITTEFIMADCDFLKTFEIDLIEGRDFDCTNSNDIADPYMNGSTSTVKRSKVSILVNETAVKQLGLTSPLGQELDFASLQGTIIGVVKDIHNQSLYSPINPMVIQYSTYPEYLAVTCRPGMESELLKSLNAAWAKLSGNSSFDYFFLDDHIMKMYASDEKVMELAGWFGLLAIILSCLGLFGLAAFIAERRNKEIGIRKVLGASVTNVTALLSFDFLKLVLIANIIAFPLAWYLMNKWLQDFAYRIELPLWVFAAAAFAAFAIALLTVSTLAVRAALANPVKSLKYE